MIINKPYIETREDQTYLISKIKDEVSNIEEDVFFAVPNEYGNYLCDEVADAFVVAMLLPALVSKQDIYINAPISEILFYQIENNLTYTLSKVFKKKPIKIIPKSTITLNFNPTAVATGFSGGIDSFTTVLQHTQDVTDNLILTNLTLFNVGSYGNDYKKTQVTFAEDIKRAKSISNIFGLPLLTIDSNFNLFYNNREEKIFNFSPRSTMCLIAGVLSLQKFFKYYFISSTGTIEDIKLSKHDQYYYEWLVTSFLSNNNSQIIIANSDLNRVEKTKYIADNKIAKNNLYVCAADIYNEKHYTQYKKDTSPNCSECIKCLRTLITLDLLGKIEHYSNRFDLQKYRKHKDSIFINVLANYKKDHFLKEIHDLMIETNYQIPKKYKIKASLFKLRNRLARIQLIRVIYRFIFRNK
jgi:hypothetical protein